MYDRDIPANPRIDLGNLSKEALHQSDIDRNENV